MKSQNFVSVLISNLLKKLNVCGVLVINLLKILKMFYFKFLTMDIFKLNLIIY